MRRELIYAAAVGGCVGALMTMAMGLVVPLGAQTEGTDAAFGTITCQKLLVEYEDVAKTEITPAYIEIGVGEEAQTLLTAASMGLYRDGEPRIKMESKEQGGQISVIHVDVNGGRAMTLGIGDHGGYFSAMGKDGGRAVIKVGEHGGTVSVGGNGSSKGEATMAVNEYGNGVVNTWDKNGYRMATLK